MGTQALEEVASIYIEAAKQSKKPVAELAATLGISLRTASNRVRACREAGLLDAAPKFGGTVGTNPKLLAVADALGVSVDALAAAVRTHAGGDLRVKL